MAYKVSSTAPFTEQASNTVKTNSTGTLNVTRALMKKKVGSSYDIVVLCNNSDCSLFSFLFIFNEEHCKWELRMPVESFLFVCLNGKGGNEGSREGSMEG